MSRPSQLSKSTLLPNQQQQQVAGKQVGLRNARNEDEKLGAPKCAGRDAIDMAIPKKEMAQSQKELQILEKEQGECGPRFKLQKKIGEGTYGVVYRAFDIKHNMIVALKKIKIEHSDEGIPSTAIREMSLLQELDHPGIVNLMDIVHGENKIYLVFEYFNLDMKKYLDKKGKPLTVPHVKHVIWQVLLAILHCHQRRIMHRDLKPSNLLIDESEKHVKIADFGLARSFGLPLKSYTHEVVTLWYRAPEVLLGSKVYSTGVDIWSVGCILYELAHRKPLFYGESEIGQIFKIFKCLGTPVEDLWQGASELPEMKCTFPRWRVNGNENLVKLCTNFQQYPEAIDLLTQMMQLEPSKRISVKGALAHPFFAEFHNQLSPQSSLMLTQRQNSQDHEMSSDSDNTGFSNM